MAARTFRTNRRRQGSSVIELTLLSPWFLFLFVGIVDLGFFTYSLIAVENAARVAAEYTSQSSTVAADQTRACTLIRSELDSLPGISGSTGCGGAPLTVTAESISGPDGKRATSVSVTYNGLVLIPIPGLLTRQLSFKRNVQMRVKP